MTLLAMVFYAGEYCGDMSTLTHICDIDGDITRHGEEPITTLEEACITLEMCTKRYDTPVLEGSALTVFIGRKVRGLTTPLARLDVLLQGGYAQPWLDFLDGRRVALEPIAIRRDGSATYDGVGVIVREILAKRLRRG
ncbi:hypothetical protein SAMN02787142_0564 [Burkholderia sp. WP9]|uniref:hypothetical protein n=1 Tax=Burkholderia sp. WP9 TaxID=1500263 RepID=UPI000895C4E0|nr:hypothetical protein [Burkholderia sp. WP9]SEB91997.1 hypothetical protein SAMN02787142_0564 [Burkholderia sp. WP9]